MLRNDELQAGLVTKIKGLQALLTGTSVTATEVREDQWQGTEFGYPNVRIRMISNTPVASDICNRTKFTVSFQCFSEGSSSLESDRIAGIINTALHTTQFVSNGIAFGLTATGIVPAIRSDIRTWRAEALMQGIASQSG